MLRRLGRPIEATGVWDVFACRSLDLYRGLSDVITVAFGPALARRCSVHLVSRVLGVVLTFLAVAVACPSMILMAFRGGCHGQMRLEYGKGA